ncbi:MAG: universal stress protein [Sandaracinaceae bacterium]
MSEKIVVGVDFGAEGDDALREAMRISRARDVEIHTVHVLPEPDAAGRRDHLDALSHMLGSAGEELAARTKQVASSMLGDAWEQSVTHHVRFGKPAETIQQVAVDVDANLIVVGSHARKGMQRLLLGSVAEEVLRLGRFPVLVARPRDTVGVAKTERMDAPREGEDLSSDHHYTLTERISFGGRKSHIAGLI